jgi:hypothetical protein
MNFLNHAKSVTGASLVMAAMLIGACGQNAGTKSFIIKNNLGLDRFAETISIPVKQVSDLVKKFGAENILVKDATTDSVLVSQPLDNNGDGTIDEILVQVNIEANAEQKYTLAGVENGVASQPKSILTTYSRFVPERTDDYTWENDRVAFRTYGPVAQQMVEKNQPGGTLTSGMDAWLKRVNYSIIDKWYKNDLAKVASYHIDHGEGYDPYHVGASRGLGGIGVLENDSLYVSKNFIRFKKLANGPIRTLFELTYAPWSANGRTITEKKIISLDLGSNLSRYEVILNSDQPLPNATIGITLHEKKGEVKANPEAGWFRYWEPMDDAHLGTGIVLSPTLVQEYKDHRVNTKDQSHLYVVTKPEKDKLIYYAGFGWTKSRQFNSPADWDLYLANFAKCLANPLEVKF